MKTTLIAALFAVSCTVLAAPDAHACGRYGAPSAQDVAVSDVYAALTQHQVVRYVAGVDVALFDARRGEATIAYNNGRSLLVGLLNHRGRWVVTRHVPRRQPVTRAVAAR